MAFLTATTGQGGWPLNAFLSPEGIGEGGNPKPFFAMTYAAVTRRYGMPGFLEILNRVDEFYRENRAELVSFDPRTSATESTAAQPFASGDVGLHIDSFRRSFDSEYGGFGGGQKFPPHSTLLFLINLSATELPDPVQRVALDEMVTTTLDAMMNRGLHDHLQGGFFRYCVDREWSIPHFEKMLYDQAMLLWVYSLAAARYRNDRYARTARGIVRCLEETFSSGELFISAHDADTNHKEGETYLWSAAELAEILTPSELALFRKTYRVTDAGNFEGKNHLARIAEDATATDVSETPGASIGEIRDKLLDARKRRAQPQTDRKIVTSWNALAGIALVMAHRYLGDHDCLKRARKLTETLLVKHLTNEVLHHSSLDGKLQKEEYLEDNAAVLLLLTTLYQETGETGEQITLFRQRVESFKHDGKWIESEHVDFTPVDAERYDHPTPSSSALAERAILESMIIAGDAYSERSFGAAHAEDFASLSALLQNGEFHVIESPQAIPWSSLPINSFQYPGKPLSTCYRGVCRPGLVIPQET
jgi:hypothetical protein